MEINYIYKLVGSTLPTAACCGDRTTVIVHALDDGTRWEELDWVAMDQICSGGWIRSVAIDPKRADQIELSAEQNRAAM